MRRWAGAAHSSRTRRSAFSRPVAWSWVSGPRSGARRTRYRTRAECSSPEAVAVVLAEAEQAGGKIVRPAARTDWGGTSGAFADPDGYVWEVAHNPGWTITDDGPSGSDIRCAHAGARLTGWDIGAVTTHRIQGLRCQVPAAPSTVHRPISVRDRADRLPAPRPARSPPAAATSNTDPPSHDRVVAAPTEFITDAAVLLGAAGGARQATKEPKKNQRRARRIGRSGPSPNGNQPPPWGTRFDPAVPLAAVVGSRGIYVWFRAGVPPSRSCPACS